MGRRSDLIRDVKKASVKGWHRDRHIWFNFGTYHRALPKTQSTEQKKRELQKIFLKP